MSASRGTTTLCVCADSWSD